MSLPAGLGCWDMMCPMLWGMTSKFLFIPMILRSAKSFTRKKWLLVRLRRELSIVYYIRMAPSAGASPIFCHVSMIVMRLSALSAMLLISQTKSVTKQNWSRPGS